MRDKFKLEPYNEKVFKLNTGVCVAVRSWNPNNHNPVPTLDIDILIEERGHQ